MPETAKSGHQISEDSAVAFFKAHSVRIHGSLTAENLTATFEDDRILGENGARHDVLTIAGFIVEMIDLGHARYIKAWDTYLNKFGLSTAAAARYAGRWLRIDQVHSDFEFMLDVDGGTTPIVDCLGAAFGGTLVKRGTTTINGIAAIVVASKGDEPGTAVSREYFAADGPPLPLRYELLGPLDKSSPACGGALAMEVHTLTAASFDYTTYNAPLSITAPADAVDIRGTTP